MGKLKGSALTHAEEFPQGSWVLYRPDSKSTKHQWMDMKRPDGMVRGRVLFHTPTKVRCRFYAASGSYTRVTSVDPSKLVREVQ